MVVNRDHSCKLVIFWWQTDKETEGHSHRVLQVALHAAGLKTHVSRLRRNIYGPDDQNDVRPFRTIAAAVVSAIGYEDDHWPCIRHYYVRRGDAAS